MIPERIIFVSRGITVPCRWSSQAYPKLRVLCILDIPEDARIQDLCGFKFAFHWASYFTFYIFIPRAERFRYASDVTLPTLRQQMT